MTDAEKAAVMAVMQIMPEPIPSLAAENKRLSRLIKPVAMALELGKPDDVSDEYWKTFAEYHDAMVTQKEFVGEMLSSELKAHHEYLENSANPMKLILDNLGKRFKK